MKEGITAGAAGTQPLQRTPVGATPEKGCGPFLPSLAP